jgi:hypothetical protein
LRFLSSASGRYNRLSVRRTCLEKLILTIKERSLWSLFSLPASFQIFVLECEKVSGKEKRVMNRLVIVTVVAILGMLPLGLSLAILDISHSQKQDAFRIAGAVEKPGEWTPEQLKKEFAGDIKTVSYTLKGEKGEAHCLPLLTLIQAAKPRLNPKAKNHQLAFAIMVRADDGYTICFSMGELLPQVGKRAVWLALDRNGKPLSEAEAPVELLSTDDEKPSRWVHNIASITLLDGLQTPDSKPENKAK